MTEGQAARISLLMSKHSFGIIPTALNGNPSFWQTVATAERSGCVSVQV